MFPVDDRLSFGAETELREARSYYPALAALPKNYAVFPHFCLSFCPMSFRNSKNIAKSFPLRGAPRVGMCGLVRTLVHLTSAILLLLSLGSFAAVAQSLANYTVTRTTGITYSSIAAIGNSVPSWRNSTQWVQDDNRSYPIPIGFDFWYNGVRYTTISISTNGFADFSSSTADGTIGADQLGRDYDSQNQRVSSTSGLIAWNVLAPFYDDLTTQNEADPLGTSIKFLTSGTAPYRVFTLEWINMSVWNYAGLGTSLNFQVKLYETTGVIEFVYGTMTSGSAVYSATCAFNAADLSGGLTTAVLRTQQKINTVTFTARPQNNLTSSPASNSRLEITPLSAAAPTGMNFVNVAQTSMRVRWTDNATNEVGYAIYQSSDGLNYSFVRQDPARASTGLDSADISGLVSGTTYYFRIMAVTEGQVSAAATGSQATLPAGDDTSAQSGLWSLPSTWSSGSVPGVGTNVVIHDGHTVTIDGNIIANSVTVGTGTSGSLQIGTGSTALTDTVLSAFTVRPGATFTVNAASTTTGHRLVLGGNLVNDGIVNFAPAPGSKCALTFYRTGLHTINGTGSQTNLYRLTAALGPASGDMLDIFPASLTADTAGFLTIDQGIVRLSAAGTFTPFIGNALIPQFAGFWLNNSGATVTVKDSLTVAGLLRVTSGSMTVGTAVNNRLLSSGGSFIFEGGNTSVAGSFNPKETTAITDFTMTGGTITVPTIGTTSSALQNSPFTVDVVGSSFNMSGGTIVVRAEGGAGPDDLGYVNTGSTISSVTGGTVQIGSPSSPQGQTMRVRSTIPIYNLSVSGTGNASVDGNLTVLNDVAISDTLFGGSSTLSVGHNWTDNGVFVPQSGTVLFNGSGAQTISRPGGERFFGLTVNTTGTVSWNADLAVDGPFNLSSGTANVGSDTLTLAGSVVGNGAFVSNSDGTVRYVQATGGQNILAGSYGNLTLGNAAKVFPNGGTVAVAGTFAPGTGTGHVVTGSTVNFTGVSQTVGRFDFNHLMFSGSGTPRVSGQDLVSGNLTIQPTVTLTCDSALVVNGSVTNNGTTTGSGRVVLNGGGAPHLLSGAGTYSRLQLNDTQGAILSGSLSIDDSLSLTSGVISTGTDTVRIGPTGVVSRVNGHVNGWLRKVVPAGTARAVTFEIGDAVNYAPAQIWFNTVSTGGTLSCRDTAIQHPSISSSFINPTDGVNRYWTLRPGNGLAFTPGAGDSIRLTYVSADQDVPASYPLYRVNVYNGSSWDSTDAGGRTSTTTTGKTLFGLGDFAIGVQNAAGAYRTAQSGDWNLASTWQKFDGTAWVAATASPTSTDGTITIRSGHTVTVTANLTIDQTIVEAGAHLVIGTGNITLTIAGGPGTDLTVLGTLQNASNNDIITTGTVGFAAGSRYEHRRHGGNIPLATWDATSTCVIMGGATAGATLPGNRNQAFGNFQWDYATQNAALNLAAQPGSIQGDFSITNTNGQTLQLYSAAGQSISTGGRFVVDGGTVVGFTTSTTATLTLNVSASLVVGSGQFNLSTGRGVTANLNVGDSLVVSGGTLNLSGANSTIGRINLQGHFFHPAGTITETAGGSGQINFIGSGVQHYVGGGTILNTINFTVGTGASLYLGTDTLTGSGTFTLSSGATLGIGSPQGISSSGATGNIQVTGTRSFNTGAKYVYDGTGLQLTGNGLPSTVKQLVIVNAAGVTLNASVTVSDTLFLTNGTFAIGANTLTLSNTATVTGGSMTSATTGTVVYNRASAGQPVLRAQYGNLTLNNFAKVFATDDTVRIAGTFLPGTAAGHSIAGTTFDFNGASQVIPSFRFNNLRLSGTGTKSLGATDTVQGRLDIQGVTFSDSVFTLVLNGSITNAGTHTGTGRIRLTGTSSAPSITGTGHFGNLEIDNLSFGAALGSDLIVDGILTLTRGIISAGMDTVIIGPTGSVARPVSGGHVFGYMRRSVSTSALPQSVTFDVGDSLYYAPISMAFVSVATAGTMTARTVRTEYPTLQQSGLDPAKSVNRYWDVRNNGVVFTSFDGTYTFDPLDVDAGANTAMFFVRRYTGLLWKATTTTARTATSTTAAALVGVGDFVTGELSSTFYWTGDGGSHSWKDPQNWSGLNVPLLTTTVILNGPDAIDVDTTAKARVITMANDSLVLTVLPSANLRAVDTLAMTLGTLNIQTVRFDSVTTMALSSGTVAYTAASGTQVIMPAAYRNLTLSGGGSKSAGGAFSVADTLRILPGCTLNDSTSVVTVKGNVINGGVHTGGGRILLSGGVVAHGLSGGGTFTNIELNDVVGATLAGARTTVSGTLTLTQGILTVPNVSDTLSIGATGAVTRSSGYVVGNLQKYVPTGSPSVVWEVGSLSAYRPVRIAFTSVTTPGFMTLMRVAGEHPNASHASNLVDTTMDVNIWWRLVNSGTVLGGTFEATVAYSNPGELNAGVTPTGTDFIGERWTGTAWIGVPVGQRWADSTRIDSLTAFGDFVLGKALATLLSAAQSGLWSDPAIWGGRVPGANDTVVVVSPYTITLNTNTTITKLVVNSGGTFSDSTFTLTLTGDLVLNGTWKGNGIISLTTANDTIYGTGSVAGTSILQIAGNKVVHPTANLTLHQVNVVAGDTLKNIGTVTADSIVGFGPSSVWLNAAGSTLAVNGALLTNGTLNATSCPNTVAFVGTADQTVKVTTYCDLVLSNGYTGTLPDHTKLIPSSLSVLNNLTVSPATFVQIPSSTVVSVGATFENDGRVDNQGTIRTP